MEAPTKMTMQQLADQRLAPEYRQPVKTLAECLDQLGWEHVDRPICCGKEVEITSMLGAAYKAFCPACEKFAFDVFGPEYSESGGAIYFVDHEKYDTDDSKSWVCGQRKSAVQP